MSWSPFKEHDISARDRFDIAWNDLTDREPFFGGTMFRLEIIESEKIPTMATDGDKLFYNPSFVMEQSTEENIGTELHEDFHIVNLHPIISAEMKAELGDNYNHLRFNKAADEEINQILITMGYTLPEGALHSPQYKGMLLREIYFLMEDEDTENEQEQSESDGESGNGAENDSNNGQANDDNGCGFSGSDSTTDRGSGSNSGSGSSDNGADNSGDSNADGGGNNIPDSNGNVKPDSSLDGIPHGFGNGWIITPQNEDGSDLLPEQIADKRIAAEKENIAAAYNAKKHGVGNMTVLDEAMRKYTAQTITWKDEIDDAFSIEFDLGNRWERPEKRFYSQGHILPSRRIEKTGNMAILNDMSRSVDTSLSILFADKINEVLSQFDDLDIVLINFDDGVIGEEIFHNSDDGELEIERGSAGGTDYVPPFQYLEELEFEPDIILVLTDMICSSFPSEPEVPVLWCEACCTRYREYQYDAPFGKLISIKK